MDNILELEDMDMMKCDHGNPVWYIRGGNALTYNRVGWNCIQCILRSLTRGRGNRIALR